MPFYVVSVNTHVYGSAMKPRLTKDDWIEFALKELADFGHTNLTAHNLAQRLGVSRGSFYWHFKHVQDFEKCVLQEWQDISTEQIILRLRSDDSPQIRMKNLLNQAMGQDVSLERAVRSWASMDKQIARAVADVDLRRITYVEDLLKELKVPKIERRVRALALYWASLGRIVIANPQFSELTAGEVEHLNNLFVS